MPGEVVLQGAHPQWPLLVRAGSVVPMGPFLQVCCGVGVCCEELIFEDNNCDSYGENNNNFNTDCFFI